MPAIRIWRVVVGTLVGTLAGTLALVAIFLLAALMVEEVFSLPYMLDPSRGWVFIANFVCYAFLPSIIASVVGTILGLGLKQLQSRAGLIGTSIAGITGALASTFIWTCVTHDSQGPNPLMLAGFAVASLMGPFATAWFSPKAQG